MRPVYFLLNFTLNYTLRIFYRRIKLVNTPKRFLGSTIYVSNHANSFMDPLVVAALRFPIVFFMTRSDVFTPISRPLLWASQMLPIYREHDGGDTKKLNDKVFAKCTKILKYGRNLLIFGEGFTDDEFVRRLKPVKKGAARIGFQTLESINWSKNIYMAAVGCNYSSRNTLRSDLLISTSDRFCLNDYREMYEENPNKAINEVTRRVEILMQEQITHVADIEMCDFHEQIMSINRKGLNPLNHDSNIPLIKRWRYSQELANWLNVQDTTVNNLNELRSGLSDYFGLLSKMKINDHLVYLKEQDPTLEKKKNMFLILILAPIALLGLVHCGLGYYLTKRFVEKSFKRKVFWGSVKLILGKLVIAILNIPTLFLFYYLIYPSVWLSILYFLLIGLFGLAAYVWMINIKSYKIKSILEKQNLDKIIEKRKNLVSQINNIIPDFNLTLKG